MESTCRPLTGGGIMSHPVNDMLMEQFYEEGLEEGSSQGLEGDALEEFAEKYAEEKFWNSQY